MATQNRILDEFNLEGIPPAPRGVPQIEVKFDIDQNGILNVSARDLGTGKEASVEIKQSSGLSDEEIQRMQQDAEVNAEEDRRLFALAEARNKGNNLVYQLEKQMADNADKLTDDDRAPLNAAIEKVKQASEGEDTEAITSATSELEQAAQAFGKVLYEKAGDAGAEAGEGAPAPEAAASGDSDDDAIDAEFEVKND